jgi:hypothetical protein
MTMINRHPFTQEQLSNPDAKSPLTPEQLALVSRLLRERISDFEYYTVISEIEITEQTLQSAAERVLKDDCRHLESIVSDVTDRLLRETEREMLTEAYGPGVEPFFAIQAILDEWDPIDLWMAGVPPYEYGYLTCLVLAALTEGKRAEQIVDLFHDYSSGCREDYPGQQADIAERLLRIDVSNAVVPIWYIGEPDLAKTRFLKLRYFGRFLVPQPGKERRIYLKSCTCLVEDWQMQCCGTPFKAGERVEWVVFEYDKYVDGFPDAGVFSGRVDYYYENHWSALCPEQLRNIAGTVGEIKALYYEHKEETIPGSEDGKWVVKHHAKTIGVGEADGRDADIGKLHFGCYVVTLHDCAVELKYTE